MLRLRGRNSTCSSFFFPPFILRNAHEVVTSLCKAESMAALNKSEQLGVSSSLAFSEL